MKTIAFASALALMLMLGLSAAPAQVLSPITFVSSSGTDTNDCSTPARACTSFQHAQTQTTNGGTILCVSSGDFFAVGITKSLTIDCRGHVALAHLITSDQPDVVVILRGLHLYGGYGPAGGAGVDFSNGNALHIEDCRIAAFATTANGGFGLRFRPSGASRLYVTDTVISENGLSDNSGGGGILVQPTGSGSARVVLNRVTLNKNTLGIVVDGSASSGRSVVEINDSVVAGSIGNGLVVSTAGMVINRTAVQGNLGNGILAGPGGVIHLGSSSVNGNFAAGLAYNGGQILSYQNNQVLGNNIDNNPSGVLALK